MSTLRLSFLALCSVPVLACGPAVDQGPGQETSPCNDDGTCNAGLSCVADECVDPNAGTGGPTGTGTGTMGDTDTSPDPSDDGTGPGPTDSATAVDILFIVDDSGSMGEEQANLAQSVASFVDPLIAGGMSVRVAVTTTDDSNYWCRGDAFSGAESGTFVASSCRTRLDDFNFAGGDTNAEVACTDACALDDIEIQPTTTELDGNATPRPWIEAGPDGTNLPADVSVGEALQCWLPQGINGCGFESTLESARKALRLAESDTAPEGGFLRADAHLAVIFITDEADCSFNRNLQTIVFGEEGVGNQQFWSLPDVQQTPTSAVCWNAGVTCDFDLAQDQCRSEDKTVDGEPAASASDAALYPVSDFRELLASIREDKLAFGADVFTFGIVGVPEDYGTTGSIIYDGTVDNDPGSYWASFGVSPGCTASPAGQAVPPVRLRELVEDSPWGENGKLYSVCSNDYSAAISDIASTIAGQSP